jgi:hypothetical protein
VNVILFAPSFICGRLLATLDLVTVFPKPLADASSNLATAVLFGNKNIVPMSTIKGQNIDEIMLGFIIPIKANKAVVSFLNFADSRCHGIAKGIVVKNSNIGFHISLPPNQYQVFAPCEYILPHPCLFVNNFIIIFYNFLFFRLKSKGQYAISAFFIYRRIWMITQKTVVVLALLTPFSCDFFYNSLQ